MNCTKCHLHEDAETVKVSSRGSDNPVILFVAEAPGKNENKKGIVLIGPAGKKLDSLIKYSGLDPTLCRFTNVVRCIPYKDTYRGVRPPTDEEILACRGYLETEIITKNPVYIVPLGATAVKFFLPKSKSVTSVRGKKFVTEFPSLSFRYEKLRRWLTAKNLDDSNFPYSENATQIRKQLEKAKDLGFELKTKNYTVIPTYHPAAILRRGTNDSLDIEGRMLEDFSLIKKYVGGDKEDCNYRLLTTIDDVKKSYNEIKTLYRRRKIDRISIDIETTSVGETKKDKDYIGSMAFLSSFFDMVLFSISYGDGSAITIPWNHPESPFVDDRLSLDILINLTNELLDEIPVVGHNLTFDIKGLRKLGINVKKVVGDTYLSSWTLFNDTVKHGLEDLATKFTNIVAHKSELNETMDSIPLWVPLEDKYLDDRVLNNVPKFCIEDEQFNIYRPRSMMDISIDIVHKYCCLDADTTLRLDCIFNDMMEKRGLLEPHTNLTVESILPLSDIEYSGVRVDLPVLEKAFVEYSDLLDSYYKFFNDLGYLSEAKGIIEFNTQKKVKEVKLSSSRIKATILYDILDLPIVKETKTGPSTDKETLKMLLSECNELRSASNDPDEEYYQHRIDVINKFKEFNKFFKLFTSYIKPIPTYVDEYSYVHTNIGNRTTDTGRCNCWKPSLHTIPWKSIIKNAFIPDHDDGLIGISDYSQVELRILGLVSGDKRLLKAFLEGKDLHRYVASIVLNKPENEVTEAERRRIKTVNFGIVYGRGAGAIAVQEEISKEQAQGIIDRVFEEFPGVGEFVRRQHEIVHRDMQVITISGFTRLFPEGVYSDDQLERRAQNTPIQGPASDVNLYAMNYLYRMMKKLKLKSRIWCIIHDSICKSISPDELLTVLRATEKCMVTLTPRNLKWLKVPLECDFELGVSWGNLVKCKLLSDRKIEIDGISEDHDKILDRMSRWSSVPTVESKKMYTKEEKSCVKSVLIF